MSGSLKTDVKEVLKVLKMQSDLADLLKDQGLHFIANAMVDRSEVDKLILFQSARLSNKEAKSLLKLHKSARKRAKVRETVEVHYKRKLNQLRRKFATMLRETGKLSNLSNLPKNKKAHIEVP